MIVWCLSPTGGVLNAVDSSLKFKLRLRACDGARDVAAGCLRCAGSSGSWRSVGKQEPSAVGALRCVLKEAFVEAPFKSREECLSEYWDAVTAVLGTTVEEYAQGMSCRELSPGIFHIEFAHQLLMASTMLRIQERYECPCADFRGKHFSLATYKAWERGNDPARGFTYYDRWPGFNVPGGVVQAALREEDLLPREQALKAVLSNEAVLCREVFYIIGTTTDDETTSLYHEVCHAMYEVNASYRADVDKELSTISEASMCRMKAWLRCEQYANVERILNDEVHAYLSEGDQLGCDTHEAATHTRRLRSIFLEHAGELAYLLSTVTEEQSDSTPSTSFE